MITLFAFALAVQQPETIWLSPTSICFHPRGSRIVELRPGRLDTVSTGGRRISVGVMTVNGHETVFDESVAGSAKGKPWLDPYRPIVVGKDRYVQYGLPRVIELNALTWVAEKDGVAIMAEKGNPSRDVLYVLTQAAGCEFQPYRRDVPAAAAGRARAAPPAAQGPKLQPADLAPGRAAGEPN